MRRLYCGNFLGWILYVIGAVLQFGMKFSDLSGEISSSSLIYVFYEQPETPSFCVVSHIPALAFDDDAFLSLFIREPEDVWATNTPDHRCGTPLEWKPSMANIPLLRRAMRTSAGIIISPTKAV
jgi:hypothetical protein